MVTGGAGFIGSHLCDSLVEKGYTVRCYDDLSFGSIRNIEHLIQNAGFRFLQEDVCDFSTLNDASRDVSIIFHLAARKIPRYGDALTTLKVNNEGTRNVFEAAAVNRCKVLLASTSDVYGKGNPPFKESDDLLLGRSDIRRWSYAASKVFDEHLALAYHDEKKVPTAILRFFGTYGPRHHRSWWGGPQSVFIDQILNNEEVTVHGDGSQTRSFTYVDDLISGIIAASENKEAEGEIINLGSDEEITILDLAKLIGRIIDKSKEPKFKFIRYESFGGGYEDVKRRIPDLSKAKRILGYEWRMRLTDGLSKTIEWHRNNPT
ncbi:MAG: GDP-mannose 4,6-dehydratase [Candidatus Zixiibacteriota bacterium]|nr:MAG: GDP-mannose 4,6-dehydratase [candidate division Zixibacteria bacterium]